MTIRNRKLLLLATKIYNAKNDIASQNMKEKFELKQPSYNFKFDLSHFIQATFHGCSYRSSPPYRRTPRLKCDFNRVA